jgi:hypothetical protein
MDEDLNFDGKLWFGGEKCSIINLSMTKMLWGVVNREAW